MSSREVSLVPVWLPKTGKWPGSRRFGEINVEKRVFFCGNSYNVRPPMIAFSCFITPITMVYGIYNYSYWGS